MRYSAAEIHDLIRAAERAAVEPPHESSQPVWFRLLGTL